MDNFTRGYIECALWSSSAEIEPHTDRSFMDHNYDESDLHPDALRQMTEDCEDFQEANAEDLGRYFYIGATSDPMQRAGHDFWFTRNGHGAGFWDRGLDALGDRLSAASRAYGPCDLYLGDDDKIHTYP